MLDQGGAGQCSESRKQLIRRFAGVAAAAEQLESKLARGEACDLRSYAALCSTMIAIARHLSPNQTSRNVSLTLSEYLKLKAEEGDS